jgi:hypothetical protein
MFCDRRPDGRLAVHAVLQGRLQVILDERLFEDSAPWVSI